MDDYISREAVIKYLKYCSGGYDYIETETKGAINDINAIPAADVRPVVHGKWSRVDYEPCGHDYICSECGCKSDGAWNFCQNCGAGMKEVNSGDTRTQG